MKKNQTMNDLDDDLLKELGLEPQAESKPKAPAKVAVDDKPAAPKSATKQTSPSPSQSASASVAEKPKPAAPKKVAPPQGLAQATQIQVVAVVGKKTTTLKELMELNEGSLLELNKLPNEMIDLVANGKLVAKGQLVLIDGRVGVQIRQVYR